MKKLDIARAWRDEDYYLSLSPEERSQIPDHPAGLVEVSDDDLRHVAGGTSEGCTRPISPCESCDPFVC